jgi:transposase
MISKGDFLVIKDLFAKGNSKRQIAKLLKINRRTVTKKLQETEYSNPISKTILRVSILEPYKAYIRDFISKSNYRIPYSVILEDIKELGYPGSRSILQEFLIRFETEPGEQLQVDWSTLRKGRQPIYAFVATMGYSRQTFVYFTDNMIAEILIMCHEQAFLFFGGITKTILYDNMATIVDKRNAYGTGKHKFNAPMYDLSKKLGFKIRLCQPYRAQTKGKIERFNGYLKGNFYRPLLIKLKDANLEVTPAVLNERIYRWLDKANNRIHDTTKQKPSVLFAKEQNYLLPYIPEPIKNRAAAYPKVLPQVTVQKPILTAYDQLLNEGVAT